MNHQGNVKLNSIQHRMIDGLIMTSEKGNMDSLDSRAYKRLTERHRAHIFIESTQSDSVST